MNKLKSTIKNEFQGWRFWEVAWMIFCASVICVVSSFYKDSWIGIAGAACGIVASVLTGKGKISAYIIGGIGRVLYAFVAWKALFYGEVMLNLLYFVPMEFYGIYVWNKNMNSETHEVNKRSMNRKQLILLAVIIMAATFLYGILLRQLGGALPYVDSFTNVVSIIAMIVTIKRYWQQWILWCVVNAVSIVMWIFSFINGNGSIAVLLMWCIYLSNSIIMMFKWKKE